MGKDKLKRFKENEGFKCLVQPTTQEVLGVDYRLKGNWNGDFFANEAPIVLELGCGRGEYTIDLALRDPRRNFIGVDIKGARLWKGAKYTQENGLPNVGFLRTRIEFIESVFALGEVDEIWITFADPQIKRENKRLTSPVFMEHYRRIMREGGRVNLKTDSRFLYEYTLAMARQNGLRVLAACADVYGDGGREYLMGSEFAQKCGEDAVRAIFEVQTRYEEMFLEQGIAITFLSFVVDRDGSYVYPKWNEDMWER